MESKASHLILILLSSPSLWLFLAFRPEICHSCSFFSPLHGILYPCMASICLACWKKAIIHLVVAVRWKNLFLPGLVVPDMADEVIFPQGLVVFFVPFQEKLFNLLIIPANINQEVHKNEHEPFPAVLKPLEAGLNAQREEFFRYGS